MLSPAEILEAEHAVGVPGEGGTQLAPGERVSAGEIRVGDRAASLGGVRGCAASSVLSVDSFGSTQHVLIRASQSQL